MNYINNIATEKIVYPIVKIVSDDISINVYFDVYVVTAIMGTRDTIITSITDFLIES